MEEGEEVGREEGPHGILPGGLRRRVRALAVAAGRAKRHKLGRVRIFTNAQAAIARMTHDEPGPGQTYGIQARQAIAILRKQEPAVEVEINWCPAHKGIPGNEVADEWAKLAASEPDGHGVEWLARADGTRLPERATSLAHLRRRATEKKWPEARSWCERRNLNKGYVLRKKGKQDCLPGRRNARPRGITSSSPGTPSRACT